MKAIQEEGRRREGKKGEGGERKLLKSSNHSLHFFSGKVCPRFFNNLSILYDAV